MQKSGFWRRAPLLLMLCVLSACASLQSQDAGVSDHPMVVLKLDDYRADEGVHPGWANVFALLNRRGVIATIGVIGEGLERPDPAAVSWLLEQRARGHELWNHGYCHCRSGPDNSDIREFRGAGFPAQIAALRRTQYLAETVLGEPFTVFGAPYNSTDADTAQAIAQIPSLKVWMFKDTNAEIAPTSLAQLRRAPELNIEYPVHIPDASRFIEAYRAAPLDQVIVIQGHPRSWANEPERFAQFSQIVDFLIAQDARFIGPSEAAELGR